MQREDGTNVNQWHWKEKDCMAWTKGRLGELFSSLPLVEGAANAHTTGLESVTGMQRCT
jgi:activator of HSP90 ATPase